MIHEILPKRFDNQFKKCIPESRDYIFCFDNDEVLLKDEFIPQLFQLNIRKEHWCKLRYLFSIDENDFFLNDERISLLDQNFTFRNIKEYFEEHLDWMGFSLVIAYQLFRWYEGNKYCGKCGKEMSTKDDERMLYCTCGKVVYPNISPVIIVGIVNNDKLLLTKYANRNYNEYSLIAGFVEIGETLEEAVCREVYEEVGLKVQDIQYFKSQPWPFSDSMMIGFFAKLSGDENIVLDYKELSFGKWFGREEIPEQKFDLSIGNEMIDLFKKGKLKKKESIVY